MSEQDYFKNALSDFTFETACGGAIRHLADLGYTVSQIKEQLAFPTALEKVRKTVWEHMLDTGALCLEEPGKQGTSEKFDYIREYDQYGKASFRRVAVSAGGPGEPVIWRERDFSPERDGTFTDFLAAKCRENSPENAYVSCAFGLNAERESASPKASFQVLDKRQQDYIQGLPWPEKIVYHRLDSRMREIIVKLYENACYRGTCYFLKTGEKLHIHNKT